MKPTVAVLIDGGFFLKRYYDLYKGSETHNAETIAKNICRAAMKHVSVKHELYKLRLQLFEELKKKRKVALRLGQISDFGNWQIYPSKVKALLKGEIALKDIREIDVFYEMRQKGIDMKIGVDIASLALKKQVNQIVLVSGDEDFVPASKLARREGIDFILDPLWNHVNANLFEHIDGLNSTSPKPPKTNKN